MHTGKKNRIGVASGNNKKYFIYYNFYTFNRISGKLATLTEQSHFTKQI
jgi:hypothetical protein